MAMKKTERRPRAAAAAQGEAGESMSLDEIKELIELVAAKQFTEFELSRGDFRLRLQRGGAPRPAVAPAGAGVSADAVTEEQGTPPTEAPDEALHYITSPIVGTFFRAPSPTAEPFVTIGDEIEAGAKLCIIEAMKLMNEITSEVGGTVAKVFAENGQPVEYGQRLFGIKV
jgi:acetyl-CoA carboxylase biotin carboxyl carrier protein